MYTWKTSFAEQIRIQAALYIILIACTWIIGLFVIHLPTEAYVTVSSAISILYIFFWIISSFFRGMTQLKIDESEMSYYGAIVGRKIVNVNDISEIRFSLYYYVGAFYTVYGKSSHGSNSKKILVSISNTVPNIEMKKIVALLKTKNPTIDVPKWLE